MRGALFVTFVAILGCGKPTPPASPAAPAFDPLARRREADAQGAFQFDAACASIEATLAKVKKLAPVAGGDAKEALLEVAAMLDGAGTTLADHIEEPAPLANYRHQEPVGERRKALADGLDALRDLREARTTLDDLAANVPPEHAAPLAAIGSLNDETIDAVESGIGRLGGKIPPEP